METYEALVIFPSQAAAEPLSDGKNAFEDLIKKYEGKILNRTELGRRLLGYVIKKTREGYFASFDFELAPDKIQPLSYALRLSEGVVKFTIVRKAKPRAARRLKVASKPKPAQAPHHRTSPAEKARIH